MIWWQFLFRSTNILRTNYGPTSHDVMAQFRSRTWVVKHGSLSPSWVGVRPYNSSRIVRKALIRTWSSIRCTSPRSCFTTYFFARGLFFFHSLGDTKCGGGIGFALLLAVWEPRNVFGASTFPSRQVDSSTNFLRQSWWCQPKKSPLMVDGSTKTQFKVHVSTTSLGLLVD